MRRAIQSWTRLNFSNVDLSATSIPGTRALIRNEFRSQIARPQGKHDEPDVSRARRNYAVTPSTFTITRFAR